MSKNRFKWDRYAPIAFMFIIGLSLGLVIGFAFGVENAGSSNMIYFLLFPIVVLLIAFVIFNMIARRVDKAA